MTLSPPALNSREPVKPALICVGGEIFRLRWDNYTMCPGSVLDDHLTWNLRIPYKNEISLIWLS
jgi:hypothetical protein